MRIRRLVSIGSVLAATAAMTVPGLATPERGSDAAPVAASATTPFPLPFYYDLYTFREDGGRTAVVAAIAVPVETLRRERRTDGVRYRFDVRFVVADTARRTVYRSDDSVFVAMPYTLPGEHLLHTYVEVRAPPSSSTVQRVVVTDAARHGVGQLYSSGFVIPDYSGTELMLSDIALGLPGAAGGWTRGGVTLALLPTSQFPESAFDVFYEIYNLPAGSAYETEVAIEPLDGPNDTDRTVRTTFSSVSTARPDATLVELRRVESALPEGRYLLTVTVRDEGRGRVASNSREIDVRGWGEGTTMVPALPRGARRVRWE